MFPIKRLRVVVGQLEFVKRTWSFIGQCNDRGSVRAKLQYLTQVPYTCVTSNAGVSLIRNPLIRQKVVTKSYHKKCF